VKILLDSCAFIWLAAGNPQLSQKAKDLFVDPESDLYLSTVSVLEISIKFAAGKLALSHPPAQLIPKVREAFGIASLPLDEESALHLARLPRLHGDPFDRMLICQSIIHGLAILTPDEAITQYPAHTIW
jgi:PIN domain nuclease of toxin-antitoxin system